MTDNKMKDWFDHRKCKQIIPPGAQWKMGQKLTVYVIKINHHQSWRWSSWESALPSVVLSLPLCNASQPEKRIMCQMHAVLPSTFATVTPECPSVIFLSSRSFFPGHPELHGKQCSNMRFLTSSCTQELLVFSGWFYCAFLFSQHLTSNL